MKALLDVSFLLPLAWSTHQFYDAANRWFDRNEKHGWCTCEITQLGFIRISSNQTIFGSDAATPAEAALLLAELTENRLHHYLSQHEPPAKYLKGMSLLNPGKITDAYLIYLAGLHRTKFVTFDRRLSALAGAEGVVEVVHPGL